MELVWLYFLVPAYVANISALLARFFPAWPMDFRIRLGGRRLLGSHKTWAGFAIGVGAASLTGYLQQVFTPGMADGGILVGFLLGCGALVGDAVKSFFKRRAGLSPGKAWPPWDQFDFTVGALLFVSPVVFPGWLTSLMLVLVSGMLHVLSTVLGFWLGIKRQPL